MRMVQLWRKFQELQVELLEECEDWDPFPFECQLRKRLWHACLGYLGGDLVKIVPSMATSIELDASLPHCTANPASLQSLLLILFPCC